MIERAALLLSLRPRHAQAIIDGRKTVDVRRRRISAPSGMRVILYATSPVKAIVGTATLLESRVCSVEAAWTEFATTLGLERDELVTYIGGRTACLLILERVHRLRYPMHLADLASSGVFKPPQSYRFVGPRDPPTLQRLAKTLVRDGEPVIDLAERLGEVLIANESTP
jgi:predicted transcriptional regulator